VKQDRLGLLLETFPRDVWDEASQTFVSLLVARCLLSTQPLDWEDLQECRGRWNLPGSKNIPDGCGSLNQTFPGNNHARSHPSAVEESEESRSKEEQHTHCPCPQLVERCTVWQILPTWVSMVSLSASSGRLHLRITAGPHHSPRHVRLFHRVTSGLPMPTEAV